MRGSPKRRIKVPDFPIEDIADAYAYYVLILDIPEETFWDADVWFVRSVAANKAAYDRWLAEAMTKDK